MIEVLTQLRVLYVQSGKSQQQIAESTGYSKPTISNILSGKSEDVRLQTVLDIAAELGAELALISDHSRKAISQQDISFYREEIAARESDIVDLKENLRLRNEQIEAQRRNHEDLKRSTDIELERVRSEYEDDVRFYREQIELLKDQLHRKDRYIDILIEAANKGGDLKAVEKIKGVE